jgi:hypothetical protein
MSRVGTKLNAEVVRRIYMCKMSPLFHVPQYKKVLIHILAKDLGVTEKTIRDIWNRKSWKEVTDKLPGGL